MKNISVKIEYSFPNDGVHTRNWEFTDTPQIRSIVSLMEDCLIGKLNRKDIIGCSNSFTPNVSYKWVEIQIDPMSGLQGLSKDDPITKKIYIVDSEENYKKLDENPNIISWKVIEIKENPINNEKHVCETLQKECKALDFKDMNDIIKLSWAVYNLKEIKSSVDFSTENLERIISSYNSLTNNFQGTLNYELIKNILKTLASINCPSLDWYNRVRTALLKETTTFLEFMKEMYEE